MVKILCISGSQPRHLYYINKISEKFKIEGCLLTERGSLIPKVPSGLKGRDKKNYELHFKNREKAEYKYFGREGLPNTNVLEVSYNDLSLRKSVDFVKKIKPDLVLIFGSSMIRDPLYSILPKETINLHLGLSPRYKGSATLFWPFYFLEPNFAGSTFHYITDNPDSGSVIHQLVPKLDISDRIHDVGCKTVVDSTMAAIKLVDIFNKNGKWEIHKQISPGKTFLTTDFKPQHLRVIYDIYKDRIVREFLEGRLGHTNPKLFRQFK